MKSPFPGMDPYLEDYWPDVHSRLATYASDHLNPRLPPGLRARIQESTAIEADEPDEGDRDTYVPDVQIRTTSSKTTRRAANSSPPPMKPIVVTRSVSEPQRSVHIVTTEKGRLVTAIEFLSPSNKIGSEGRDDYIEKRKGILAAGASLVEVDLIRAGLHVLAFDPAKLPARSRMPYAVAAIRWWKPRKVEIYPIPLRAPLPTISIPLRKTDSDVTLNLQELIEEAYEKGGYDGDIDYRQDPSPALDPLDAAWLNKLLKAAGKR
jgi:hypothetical protein